MKKEYEVREKHFMDWRNLRNEQGGFGKFKPHIFWPTFQRMGHSAIDLHTCTCYRKYLDSSCNLCKGCSAPNSERPKDKTLLGPLDSRWCAYFEPKD